MPFESIDVKIGSIAPDFCLQATDGNIVSLSDFRGKANVILFFIRETTCGQFQRTASIVVDKESIVRYIKRTTVPNVWLQESRELFGFVDSLQ